MIVLESCPKLFWTALMHIPFAHKLIIQKQKCRLLFEPYQHILKQDWNSYKQTCLLLHWEQKWGVFLITYQSNKMPSLFFFIISCHGSFYFLHLLHTIECHLLVKSIVYFLFCLFIELQIDTWLFVFSTYMFRRNWLGVVSASNWHLVESFKESFGHNNMYSWSFSLTYLIKLLLWFFHCWQK